MQEGSNKSNPATVFCHRTPHDRVHHLDTVEHKEDGRSILVNWAGIGIRVFLVPREFKPGSRWLADDAVLLLTVLIMVSIDEEITEARLVVFVVSHVLEDGSVCTFYHQPSWCPSPCCSNGK